MTRVAIVHFTGPPGVGGIEKLISAQVDVLNRLGHEVRVVVGRDTAVSGAEVVVVPALHPADSGVSAARQTLQSTFPDRSHPMVGTIASELDHALASCHACWVHNIFTVYLNAFATVAVSQLVESRRDIRWVAWCEDLTAGSVFQKELSATEALTARRALPGVRYVTLSRVRRSELTAFFWPGDVDVGVVPPPVDVGQWLGPADETGRVLRTTSLLEADAVVLVPAKILLHKGLDRAVRVAGALRELVSRPLVLVTGAASPHEPQVSASLETWLERIAADRDITGTFYFLAQLLGRPPPDRTVRELMMLSDVVFLPSHEEGFGLPLREAALVRAPILCSDIPVFREIAGGAARFFKLDGADSAVAEMIVDIARLPENVARREAMRSEMEFEKRLRELV
jgi:glycosyltransferase involved in cell wall biosynthesis